MVQTGEHGAERHKGRRDSQRTGGAARFRKRAHAELNTARNTEAARSPRWPLRVTREKADNVVVHDVGEQNQQED
jgi:hypothetical protein